MDKDEYELIPVSPLRRLEKRIETLEHFSAGDSKDIFKDIIDIVRMNQLIVDQLATSSDALRIELAKLPGKLDELLFNMKELISFIKSAGEVETSGVTPEVMKPVVDKLDELVKANKSITERNDSMLELLDTISKRLRRPAPTARRVLHQPSQLRQPMMKPLKARTQ